MLSVVIVVVVGEGKRQVRGKPSQQCFCSCRQLKHRGRIGTSKDFQTKILYFTTYLARIVFICPTHHPSTYLQNSFRGAQWARAARLRM